MLFPPVSMQMEKQQRAMTKLVIAEPRRKEGRSLTKKKSSFLPFLQHYFLCFMAYAMVGWAYEVFLEVVIYRWGYSDRGVLIGPWCPVYGVGAMAFLLCFHRLMKRRDPDWLKWVKPLLIFLGCMAVATAIELATSYILEAITGSWPWQTYVDYAINFEGRIALSPSLRFGLGGVLFLYGLQPLFDRAINRLTSDSLTLVSSIMFVVLLADCLLTVFVF